FSKRTRPAGSEALFERPQIDLVRPRRSRLAMELPVGFDNRLDAEQAILAARFDDARHGFAQALAVDPTIDYHMCNVQAVRPVLPRHALGDRPQSGLRGSKMRVARLAAQARGSAGEDHATSS